MPEAKILRFDEMEAGPQGDGEAGPWKISWVGGPRGYENASPARAVSSLGSSIGMMHMACEPGERSTRQNATMYVVVNGSVEIEAGDDFRAKAEERDGIYVPAGIPHAIRGVSDNGAQVIYLRDGAEPENTGSSAAPSRPENEAGRPQIVRYGDLEPFRDGPRAREPGFKRWVVNWMGGPQGYVNFNRDVAVTSDRLSVGIMALDPGCRVLHHHHPDPELYVLLAGSLAIDIGNGTTELDRFDVVHFPAYCVHGVRNPGEEVAYVMWIYETPQRDGVATYTGLQ